MDYILQGDPKEVAKVIRENRIRVQRGVISFTPVEPETVLEKVEVIEEHETEKVDIVPNSAETVPNTDETAQKEGDFVPECEISESMDDKDITVEDLQEVDLDADDKTPTTDDTKDVPAADSKEEPTARKTSKRSKKSE